jgi:hypothetical protein
MNCSSLAPRDDPKIACRVRLWHGESVTVCVHPREWKCVAITGGTRMLVSCCGLVFPSEIRNCGEHYRYGRPSGVRPLDFGVPTHGDYEATARIDWELAIPDVLREGLERWADALETWQSLSCEQMRKELSFVFRAQSAGTTTERQLTLLNRLKAGDHAG